MNATATSQSGRKQAASPKPAYKAERLMQVLLAPVVSEKSTFVADKHEQVIFRVVADATKPEIKAAVELMFKVEVESVQVANVKGKEKRFGRFIGRRRHWKKAYICLKPGQEINFAAGEAK
ncbi:MAG TPA: 50S ribosomal protein L23 [Burkholderiales bacterium]